MTPVAFGMSLILKANPVTVNTMAIWQWSANASDPASFAFELGLFGQPEDLYGIQRFNKTDGHFDKRDPSMHTLVAVDDLSPEPSDRKVLASLDFDVISVATTLTFPSISATVSTTQFTASPSVVNQSSTKIVAAIVGGALGGVFLICTVVIVLLFWKQRREAEAERPFYPMRPITISMGAQRYRRA
ncbi:hypothetical protein C8J56DRAFT_1056871 [Mycena floridula]|nr:hypothetical protein C8J56DRAFT_1056871 [Mycena floridula]